MTLANEWTRRGVALAIAAVSAAALVACSGDGDGFELEITPQKIQTELAKGFPRESCQSSVICVAAHSPQLVLVNGSPRIGLKVQLSSRSPLINSATAQIGSTALSAKLRYERTEAALYLDDVKIDDVQFKNVPDAVSALVRDLSQPLLRKSLTAKPIYTIPADKLSDRLQRMALHSVEIKGGKVVAVVRLPGG
jgi:hypothetical protein